MSKLIPFLAQSTGLSEHDVRAIVVNAYARYKHYTIPKRNGGVRAIAQPAREVKALQRALVRALKTRLVIHPAAMAYRTGVSIADNARTHAMNNGPIKKFDFKDFFTSITVHDWTHYCRINNVFKDYEDIAASSNILFHKVRGLSGLRLAIGAPSSPFISNVLMAEFDSKLSRLVAQDHCTYTRYADDLTFSAPRTGYLVNVERCLKKTIEEVRYPSLSINPEKTVTATRKVRRSVTGLVITNDGLVSLGYERKRVIRSKVYHALRGDLSIEDRNFLCGLLAFANDVEPSFVQSLSAKYGTVEIASLMRDHVTHLSPLI